MIKMFGRILLVVFLSSVIIACEKEEDILDVLILRIVAEYKFRKIRIMQDEIFKNVYKAFENNDEEKVRELQNTLTNLKKEEKQIMENLGDRTIN